MNNGQHHSRRHNGSHNDERARDSRVINRPSFDSDERFNDSTERDERAFGGRPGTSQRQQFGQGYGPESYGPAYGQDRVDEEGRWKNGGYAQGGGYGRDYEGRSSSTRGGYGREQGYSSSSMVSGQQGRDQGYGYGDRSRDADQRRGYGMQRDLDDRSSRGGFRLDGDLDRRDMQSRRDPAFTERDRHDRGFDDRGIGAPQRSNDDYGRQYSSSSSSGMHDRGYERGYDRTAGDMRERAFFGDNDWRSRDVGNRDFDRDMDRSDRNTDRDDGYVARQGWTGGSSRGASSYGTSSTSSSSRYPSGPKGYQRSDDRVKEDVCDRLAAMADLDSSDVEVSVTGGEVTLTGTVPHRSMKYRCEQTCELVTGVKDIVNHIRVKDSSRSSSSNMSSSTSSSTSSNMSGTESKTAMLSSSSTDKNPNDKSLSLSSNKNDKGDKADKNEKSDETAGASSKNRQ